MLKKVEFEGQEIGYKIEGLAGKTLLALHGFLEDHSIFDLPFFRLRRCSSDRHRPSRIWGIQRNKA